LDARFELLAAIGSGAMGTVYRAWDHDRGVPVAVKLLHAVETAQRFEREASVLSQIHHPNIVEYVAHGMTASGEAWLAMEWLDGDDVSTRIKTRAMTPGEAQTLLRAVASGLAWAHERGFVHRDMKPSNVLIPHGELARAKVVDFGLARDVARDEELTKTGALIGTLDYMPPEQLTDAKRVDPRADVFSLGAVLYRCLTGRAPVIGRSLPELVLNIVRQPIPPITDFRSDVPPPFVNLLAWMLQKDANLRPVDATEVLSALDALERDDTVAQDFEAMTELTARPDFAADEARESWRALDATGTVRMDSRMSVPVPLAVPSQPSTVPLPEVSSAAPGVQIVARRPNLLREWWPLMILAGVALGLLAEVMLR
jgi:serine/threonine protein kinase